MKRRGFLKFALGATTGLVASPMIWSTLYDFAYWSQNRSAIPRLQDGKNEYIPTVSKICPGGTPIIVRTVDGRIIRTLGNPNNNISEGGLNTLAVSEAQLLYSESRIQRPLLRALDGGFYTITWERAEQILLEKTRQAKSSCAFISNDTSSTLNEIYSAFLTAVGSKDFIFMPEEESSAKKAWNLMGGVGRLGYDLDNSDFILSIGANIFENWGTIARNRKIFKNSHPAGQDSSMTLAFAGGMQNNTAVVSDLWIPILPTTESILAFGICHELIRLGYGQDLPQIEELKKLVEPYNSHHLLAYCGLMPEKFELLMQKLLEAKRPIVISGCPMGCGGGAAPVMACIAVNMLLGRLGKEGNMVNLPIPEKVLEKSLSYTQMHQIDLVEYSQNIAGGKIDAPKLLFLHESNPIYALPKNVQIQEFLDKVDFKISFASFLDETSVKCDLILPAALGLERFDDVYTPYGSGFENWTLARPIAAPRYFARPAGEVIIALAEELGYDLGVADVPSLLQEKGKLINADFEEYISNGLTHQNPTTYFEASNFTFNLDIMKETMIAQIGRGMRLLPQIVYGVGSASTGIPPYANRIIYDYQLKTSHAVVQMNSVTAELLNLENNDMVNIETSNGKIEAVVSIFDGMMTNVVSMLVGLGHTEFDRFSMNKGANILTLAHVEREAGTGLPIWSDSDVNITKVKV